MVPSTGPGVVCYGRPYSGSEPALNRNCGRLNKFEQAQILFDRLGSAIQPLSYEQVLSDPEYDRSVYLGRRFHHTRGQDIIPILEQWQLEAARASSDFFVRYVPSLGEWRIWVYRNRHLGSYAKALVRPEEFRQLGRNYANGFGFTRLDNDSVPEAVKELARASIRVLDLDFGAVDILNTEQGPVVLEVNAAPGVSDDRRQVLKNLAYRIERWSANGCPGRNRGD